MINNSNTPLVSVVMATFNESKETISLAIKSILNQTHSNLELLIIDDSTKHETISQIDALANDPRVIVIREKARIGFVKALNIGLKNAKGKYIARMDGDDISAPNRLSLQVSFLEQNEKYSVVGGAMNIINMSGIIISSRFYPTSSLKLNLWSIFRSPFAHPTVMLRREIIDEGFFYNVDFKKSEDLEFWMRLKKHGFKFVNLGEILLDYRIDDNFSSKRSGDQLSSSYKARRDNFYWKSPLTGVLSLIVARVYTLVPRFFVDRFYNHENTKGELK